MKSYDTSYSYDKNPEPSVNTSIVVLINCPGQAENKYIKLNLKNQPIIC